MKIKIKNPRELRMMLIHKGLSQRYFSKAVGMSENYFNQIINEKKSPSPMAAKRITNYLELEFDDVFKIKGDDDNNFSK